MINFKHLPLYIVLIATAAITLISCETTSTPDYEPSAVTGLVTDASQNPLENAIVRIINPAPEVVTTTNASGNYLLELQVDSTITYTLEVRKEGYASDTQEFLAIPERDVNLPTFRLASSEGGNDGDGDTPPPPDDGSEGSAFITLQSLNHETIQVREAGGIETSEFEFLVTDSLGNPVSHLNAIDVHFEIASGPDGGESIYPETVKTVNGIAKAALTSGTAAGVVQIRASFTRDENTMQSKPVSVTISGGLPSNDHFEASSNRKNIPAATSEPAEIRALIGDRYGNTVLEGTSVYFSTNKGTINGSGTTDSDGYAVSQLQTNQTTPGIASVRVETVDENSTRIFRELNILFSGKPELTVTPETVDLADFTLQTFAVTLVDENGNPLSEGTSLEVSMDHPELVLDGDILVTLGDESTGGLGVTEFEFRLRNPEGVIISEDAVINIDVNSPNGNRSQRLQFEAPKPPLAEAASIYLESVTATDIGVQSTGQRETTQLTFVVEDQNGNPLTKENSVDVNFRFGASPGGGEYITDGTVTTNSNGEATATVISGTLAGVVQVIAEFTMDDGTTVRSSKPVQVVIHAGLPSQAHLTIIPAQRNFSVEENGQHPVTVKVGDIHGNRVPDGTAIYFTTDGGFIQGSAFTVDGEATANLTVANPIPANGEVTLTATTANDAEEYISISTNVLFTDSPIITVTPETFDILNAEDQRFDYTVMDANGNPMVEGTTITVTVEGNEIDLLGDLEITVGAPNSSFSNLDQLTNYSFIIDDAEPDVTNETPVMITIEVEGPNGTARKTIDGTKAKVRP